MVDLPLPGKPVTQTHHPLSLVMKGASNPTEDKMV